MKYFNRKTGEIGESLALEYLQRLGYELILRNYHTRFGEIDLIMRDKETTVFVEVKAKKTEDWGTPEEMFTQSKYRKVKRMATLYLHGKEVICRIDMVAVDLFSDPPALRHYPNVIFLS
ncbi:MAG: YraN family protein [Candidatus Amesbacteria bacterium]|nr:YraN family protein [Candidatus Amesbacteria bacterium]